MEVFLLVGAYAGQIREIRGDAAKEMIERGDAIDPNQPISPAKPLPSATESASPAQPSKPARRRT